MSTVSSDCSVDQLNRVVGKISALTRFLHAVEKQDGAHEVDVDLMVKLHNKAVALALVLVAVVERSAVAIKAVADVSYTSVATTIVEPVSTAHAAAAMSPDTAASALAAEADQDDDPKTPKGLVPTMLVHTPRGKTSVLLADESGLTPVAGYVALPFRADEPATPATTVATDFTTGE